MYPTPAPQQLILHVNWTPQQRMSPLTQPIWLLSPDNQSRSERKQEPWSCEPQVIIL